MSANETFSYVVGDRFSVMEDWRNLKKGDIVFLTLIDECDEHKFSLSVFSKKYLDSFYIPMDILKKEKSVTPCGILGYEIGDAFIAPHDSGYVCEGDVVYLIKDNHTNKPLFSLDKDAWSSDASFFVTSENGEPVVKPSVNS